MSDSARRTARTALAVVLALAAGLPLLVRTAGLPETLPGLGAVLAVAAAITRVMALPVVDAWMPGWLKMTAPKPTPPDPVDPPVVVPPPASRE